MKRRGLLGAFWPDETQHGLLEVALGPTEWASTRWARLQPLDVTDLATGVLPLLPLLDERLGEIAPEDPQLLRLRGAYRSVWYRNQLLLERLQALLPELRRHGLEALVAGGAAALRWYPRLGLRPVSQLDVIVPIGKAAAAEQAAVAGGWSPAQRQRVLATYAAESGLTLVVHEGAPPELAGPLGREGGYQALRESAVEFATSGGGALAPSAADDILWACAFGACSLPTASCQWLVDVHHVLASPQCPEIATLRERARRFHLVEPLRDVLTYLGATLEQDRLLDYVEGLALRPVSRRDRFAYRLGGVGSRRLAGPLRTFGSYLRASAEESLPRAAAGLPRHLQERWGTRSVAAVPVLAVRKAVRLVHAPAQPTGPAVRNRSASS